MHLNERGSEFEKLVNLEGPAREVIRSNGEVRCYYPDAKVVRIEPRTFRNAFPSLSAQQQKALTDYYEFRKAEADRVAGLETQAWVFEPKDGLRYGQKFCGSTPRPGFCSRRASQNERNEPVEQFAFTEIAIGAQDRPRDGEADVARDAAGMAGPPTPVPARPTRTDTGWTVHARAAGSRARSSTATATLRGKRAQVAHIVYSTASSPCRSSSSLTGARRILGVSCSRRRQRLHPRTPDDISS